MSSYKYRPHDHVWSGDLLLVRCSFCGDLAVSTSVRMLNPCQDYLLFFCTLCDYDRNGVGFMRFAKDADGRSPLELYDLVRTARNRLLEASTGQV